uniref:Uncharacterized protein n=1 Tax=Cacopsylla melanoneura TaxID=428564 RepID=A0A8D8ZAP0_9HEMI
MISRRWPPREWMAQCARLSTFSITFLSRLIAAISCRMLTFQKIMIHSNFITKTNAMNINGPPCTIPSYIFQASVFIPFINSSTPLKPSIIFQSSNPINNCCNPESPVMIKLRMC